MIGRRIGPYDVVAKVGEGGMGEVYRARDTRLNRDVALKVLPASFARDPDRLRRFTLEAQTAGGLNHANILTIYEIGDCDGQPFLVAELLEGETLRAKLAAGPLPVSKAVDYARQTAAGLAAAHARQIVHRDIKPENLFVTTDGRVKILDFGLAKQADGLADAADSTRLHTATSPGTVLGTVGYMSPEQVRGGRVDHRSDLFSLGVVLYELLSGARPFTGDSAVETMNAILTQDPPELTVSGRALPPALAEVVRHALEKQPDERFQSARDMAFALQAATGTSGTATAPAIEATRRRSPGRRAAVVAAAVAGALAGALVMWLARSTGGDSVDLRARRFTPLARDAAVQAQPEWSPDGRSIAYFASARRPGNASSPAGTGAGFSLVVKDLEATAPITVVARIASPHTVFWWPDGTRVGYVDDDGVWSVSRVGGDPELLHAGAYAAAALSPDGRTLACWRITTEGTVRTPALWIASPPNGALVRYERGFVGGGSFQPVFLRFSPDGTRLLLSGFLPHPENPADQTPGVWEITGTTPGMMTAPRQVFASHRWLSPPAIALFPDGRRVALASRSTPGLWLGRLDADSLARLTDGLAGEQAPSVSPDGRRIAFEMGRSNFDLVEIPLDGSTVRDVIAASHDESSGGSMADGRIVYASTQSGRDEIRVRAPDGFDRAIVAPRDFPNEDVGILTAPVPSPDGQRVAFQQLIGDEARTWIAPMSGGTPVRLGPADAETFMPDWSPDGRWIAYAALRAGSVQILKERVGSSEPPVPLVSAANVFRHLLAWSPDGTWIAHDSPDGLSLVAADGGARRVLVAGTRPRAIAWSHDSRTIYALVGDDDGWRLDAVDAGSGAVRLVRLLPADLTFTGPLSVSLRMTLSRDGTHLLTTVLRIQSDIWMMEGF
ncbi:MAG TPA: protein kinase [Vicinamibacterales bacterium]